MAFRYAAAVLPSLITWWDDACISFFTHADRTFYKTARGRGTTACFVVRNSLTNRWRIFQISTWKTQTNYILICMKCYHSLCSHHSHNIYFHDSVTVIIYNSICTSCSRTQYITDSNHLIMSWRADMSERILSKNLTETVTIQWNLTIIGVPSNKQSDTYSPTRAQPFIQQNLFALQPL